MKLRTRVAMVSIVLLVGIVFAAPFRKSVPQADSRRTVQNGPSEPSITPLSIRYPASARLLAPTVGSSASGSDSSTNMLPDSEGPGAQVEPPRPPLRFSPTPSSPPSPQMSSTKEASAVETPDEPTSRSIPSPESMVPGRSSPRWHRVVYGDNLQKLAAVYLGSRDQFLLIYEANRDVLASPNILPIGAELRIPPAPVKKPPERPPERRF